MSTVREATSKFDAMIGVAAAGCLYAQYLSVEALVAQESDPILKAVAVTARNILIDSVKEYERWKAMTP